MDITISVDERILERAREKARAQNMSVQALLCRYLESLAGEKPAEALADELLQLFREQGGRLGRPFRRGEAYEGGS